MFSACIGDEFSAWRQKKQTHIFGSTKWSNEVNASDQSAAEFKDSCGNNIQRFEVIMSECVINNF